MGKKSTKRYSPKFQFTVVLEVLKSEKSDASICHLRSRARASSNTASLRSTLPGIGHGHLPLDRPYNSPGLAPSRAARLTVRQDDRGDHVLPG